jgi:drug/metabolite transporter (DMT)-like permease
LDGVVFTLVILGAALHAGWNAILKIGGDRMSTIALVAIGHGLPAMALIPFMGSVHPDAWPYLAATTLLHVGYRIFLVRAYEAGDMSQVYPLARGTAPMLTALVAILFFGDKVGLGGFIGILMIGSGIVLMSLKGGSNEAGGFNRMNRQAFAYALITAGFIMGYTLADGFGGRASLNPHAYAVWMFAIDTPVTVTLAWFLRGNALFAGMRGHIGKGLLGGIMSFGSYWIAIWAMTRAPIAEVAALRETSVLFALLISVLLLGEKLTMPKIAASALILGGSAVLRLF